MEWPPPPPLARHAVDAFPPLFTQLQEYWRVLQEIADDMLPAMTQWDPERAPAVELERMVHYHLIMLRVAWGPAAILHQRLRTLQHHPEEPSPVERLVEQSEDTAAPTD